LYIASPKFGSDLYIHGIIALNQGFILTSMVLAAILAFIIDHDFFRAGAWSLAAALLSATGLIHAYTLTTTGVQNSFGWFAAPQFVIGYALTAGVLFTLHASRLRGRTAQG
jgi:AGZA family xanthine/uracil permease-like MFS transporter